jgi:hypothetical protein
MSWGSVRRFVVEWLLKSILMAGTLPAAVALEYVASQLR